MFESEVIPPKGSPDTGVSGRADTAVPTPILGLARLARPIFAARDVSAIEANLLERIRADFFDASALHDLSTLWQLTKRGVPALNVQAKALEISRHYALARLDGDSVPNGAPLRLLALTAPGDFLSNTPVDFITNPLGVLVDFIYLVPGEPLPERFPDHDILLVAIGYNETNRPLLSTLQPLIEQWPRPVLNQPAAIARTSREGVADALAGTPGILVPNIARLTRGEVLLIAAGHVTVPGVLSGGDFPIIARPLGSHAGQGLEKLETREALGDYLTREKADEFHISEFVDYRGNDGFFRKYRVAVIDGTPFICHMAMNDHWMIHYLNAGMTESADKRAEEAKAFATFETEFLSRHRAAFDAMYERLGLDYLTVDCGEAPDGRLLLFEADNAMVIHDMDDPEMYPYKPPQMRRVFDAFLDALRRRTQA